MSLDLRLVAYAPNGAKRGTLPTPQEFQAGMPLGDTGALSLTYPLEGPRSAFLDGATEVAVEASYDLGQTWVEPDDARYLMLRRSGDPIRDRTWKREGPQYVWRLTKAKVLPEGLLNNDGKRPFLSATAGTILRTLTQEAQARGALAGMDFSTFSGTTDSTGAAWDKIITLYYEPGVSLWTVLLNLSTQGLCDWAMRGRSLRLYRPETIQGGTSPATLYRGRDLSEAPYQATLEGLTNYAYLAMEAGASLERLNPTAPSPWGRWETYISQGGVSDPGTAAVLSDAELERGSQERVENTYGLVFTPQSPVPFRDYTLGQFLNVREGQGPAEALRLRQITLTRDTNGVVGGNVVLNDRFLEAEARLNRRVTGITGGATADGASGARPAPTGTDTRPPAAPGTPSAFSAVYLDGTTQRVAVTLSWAAPTTNDDGTALDDLDRYRVQYRASTTAAWQVLTETTDTQVSNSPWVPGTVWDFRVLAIDTSGNVSAPSAAIGHTMAVDGTPPSKPSTPTVSHRLGTVTVRHPGTASTGGPLEADTARVEYHLGTSTGFTPGASTLVGVTLTGAADYVIVTGLPYGSARFARTVAVDYAGNRSTASDTSPSISAQPIVDTDLIGRVVQAGNIALDAVTEELIADGAVRTAALDAAAVTLAKIADGAVGETKIAASAVTADKIAAFSIDAGKIRAGGITADRLVVGEAGNLFPNGYLRTGTNDGWHPSLTYSATDRPGQAFGAVYSPAARSQVQMAGQFSVDPGQEYVVGVWAKADIVGTRFYLQVNGLDSNGVPIPTAQAWTPVYAPGNAPLNTTWTRYETVLTAGPDVTQGRVSLFINHANGVIGVQSFAGMDVRRRTTAVLIADGAVTADKIIANAVTSAKVAALAIDAGKIAANAITTDKIAAGAITAVKITAGAVTADKIGTGVLTADLVLSGFIRTAVSGARVELGPTGLRKFDAQNNVTVDITSTLSRFTGRVEAAVISGSQVEGGSFSTGYTDWRRIDIEVSATSTTNPRLRFVGSAADPYTPADIGITADGDTRPLRISSPIPPGGMGNASWIDLRGQTTVNGTIVASPRIHLSSPEVHLGRFGTGAAMIVTNGTAVLDGGIRVLGMGSSSQAANVHINANMELLKVGSRRALKADIQDLAGAPAILNLRARTWVDKARLEADPTYAERTAGFIAEEVAEAGLATLVHYGPDGTPQSVAYDRVGAYLLPLIQDLYARVGALQAHPPRSMGELPPVPAPSPRLTAPRREVRPAPPVAYLVSQSAEWMTDPDADVEVLLVPQGEPTPEGAEVRGAWDVAAAERERALADLAMAGLAEVAAAKVEQAEARNAESAAEAEQQRQAMVDAAQADAAAIQEAAAQADAERAAREWADLNPPPPPEPEPVPDAEAPVPSEDDATEHTP